MTDREREAAKNPRPGDRWRKTTKAGRVVDRTVTRADGRVDSRCGFVGHVFYRTPRLLADTPDQGCWITTWEGWCRGAELVERGDS